MTKPKLEFRWDLIEKRIEAGCSGIEIANWLKCDENTFYSRFQEQYGRRFADAKKDFYAAGNSNLRLVQYVKALGGNIPMLTLLGRERLDQGKNNDQISPIEDMIALRHENMMLKAELERIVKHINDNKPETE